jgi:hypothetical protein
MESFLPDTVKTAPYQGGLQEGAKAQQIVKYADSHFCKRKMKGEIE